MITVHRTFATEIRAVSDDTVELSFSSNAPVDMGGFNEVLDHAPGAVDLSRLQAGAPVLFEHDRAKVVGVVEKAWIEGDKGRARIRFGTSELAREIARDVAARIRRNVSVGYEILKSAIIGGIRRVSKWTPLEISIVSIPADVTVGFGRSHQSKPTSQENHTMSTKALHEKRGAILKRADNIRKRATEAARELDENEKFLVSELIESARSLDAQIQDAERQENSDARRMTLRETSAGGGGFNVNRGGHEYSLVRALHGAANGQFDGIEAEYSQEEARRSGRAPEGIFVPLSVFGKRDLTATGGSSGSEGGALFTPETGGFIDALRPRLVLAQLGATVLANLTSDVKLPRQAAASAAGWENENAELDEASPTFDQVSISPKRIGAFTELSKQLLVQTSGGVESLVRNDLLAAIALGIDAAGINGSGTAPVPRGILNTSGIGSVAMGTDGGAPTFNALIDLQAALANADADIGTISFLSNPKVRAKLAKTIFDSGSGITHLDKAAALGTWGWTTQTPSNLVKGSSGAVCSAIIAGDFSQLILASFGSSADVVVDPYTKATQGITRIVVTTLADVAIRRAAYFAAIKDATTT